VDGVPDKVEQQVKVIRVKNPVLAVMHPQCSKVDRLLSTVDFLKKVSKIFGAVLMLR